MKTVDLQKLRKVLGQTYLRVIPVEEKFLYGRMDAESLEGLIHILQYHGFVEKKGTARAKKK